MSEIKHFIEKFNEGFANNDIDFIADQVTEDLVWKMPGAPDIVGKAAFRKQMEEMKNHEPAKLFIDNVIVDGKMAAANGTMTTYKDGKEEIWAFCDIYTFTNNPLKISAMHSYVLQTNAAQ